MKPTRFVIPALAVAGVAYAAWTVATDADTVTPSAPIAAPSTSPFPRAVAGAGLIEARTENIAVGSHLGGVVAAVHVRAGDRVRAGDPLFTLDDRAHRAELAVREAALLAARREVERLEAMPRPEDVPPARASAEEADVLLRDAEDQLARLERALERAAASEDEVRRQRFAVEAARRRAARADAELARLMAGAWAPELEQARAAVQRAQAEVAAARTEVERLTVRAPVDSTALRVNVRPGQFATAGDTDEPLVMLGDDEVLHVRVDIDENDAWRLRPEGRAVASLRGNRDLRADLAFVRIEPYVTPKRSLTGESTERVDTRVLQAIYAFPRSALPAYIGQQMDVYIEDLSTPPPAAGPATP